MDTRRLNFCVRQDDGESKTKGGEMREDASWYSFSGAESVELENGSQLGE